MADSSFDVAIVGGGISGLAFAHHAARGGLRCLVLEADNQPGGCIHTARATDGFWYELGAHTLYNSYGALLDILQALGLRGQLCDRHKAPYRLLVDGKVRTVPSQLAKGELFLSAWRAFSLRKPGRTVADYYGRLVGARNWRRVVSPLFSAVPSQRADDFPAEMLFKRRPRRKDFPRTFTLEQGLQTLVDRLAAQAGVTLRAHAAVTGIARVASGFALTTSDGTHLARRIALAAPADAAARLLAPALPAAAATLAKIATTAIDSTGVVFERQALAFPRLAGLVPLDDVFFSAVSRDVVPDPRWRALAFHFRTGLSLDDRLARIATVTGGGRAAFVHVAEHRSSLPSPVVGHAEIVQTIDRQVAGSGVYVTGNYFGGLAIEDCVLRSAAEARRLLSESK
jgi:oxygen-dependent protoporphyrinogen oxidase